MGAGAGLRRPGVLLPARARPHPIHFGSRERILTSLTTIFPNGFEARSMQLVAPEIAFREEAERNGLLIDEIIADGEIHRCGHRDSKRSQLDGWYVLHADNIPAGEFGCWKEPQFQVSWVADIGRSMTLGEQVAHQQRIKQLKDQREQSRLMAQEAAAERADDILRACVDASHEHAYLMAKGVKAHGIKLNRAGELVIPIVNIDGEVQSVQTIDANGRKLYLKGGKKEGGFHEIRGDRKRIFVCEGYATGATVFEATGSSVFVAFDTQGLLPVARSVRQMFPAARIYMAADNDHRTEAEKGVNPGIAKARAAAKEVMAEVIYPEFTADERAQENAPSDWNDLARLRGLSVVEEQIGMVVKNEPKLLFEFSRADQLALKNIDWIVEGYIESDSLVQLFGDPGCGKSFVAIDMACCIATGMGWHGHEVSQGSVFYIAGEGHNGLARRLKAWEIGTGCSLVDTPLYKSHRAAQLYDASEAAIVAESIHALVNECGARPKAIVIDTVARNMGGDENSTQDMNAFIAHLDHYLRQPYGCAVIVVHHSGAADKDRSRGSTALRGALDAEYKVALDPNSKVILLESKKMKEAELPPSKSFSLGQVDLPLFDKYGAAIKGAHLVTVDISAVVKAANDKQEFLGKNLRKALDTLAGIEYSRARDGNKAPITNDEWRQACGECDLDRRRYAEAKARLIEKSLVQEFGDGCVRIRPKASESDGLVASE